MQSPGIGARPPRSLAGERVLAGAHARGELVAQAVAGFTHAAGEVAARGDVVEALGNAFGLLPIAQALEDRAGRELRTKRGDPGLGRGAGSQPSGRAAHVSAATADARTRRALGCRAVTGFGDRLAAAGGHARAFVHARARRGHCVRARVDGDAGRASTRVRVDLGTCRAAGGRAGQLQTRIDPRVLANPGVGWNADRTAAWIRVGHRTVETGDGRAHDDRTGGGAASACDAARAAHSTGSGRGTASACAARSNSAAAALLACRPTRATCRPALASRSGLVTTRGHGPAGTAVHASYPRQARRPARTRDATATATAHADSSTGSLTALATASGLVQPQAATAAALRVERGETERKHCKEPVHVLTGSLRAARPMPGAWGIGHGKASRHLAVAAGASKSEI
jgi:hypothetical protein